MKVFLHCKKNSLDKQKVSTTLVRIHGKMKKKKNINSLYLETYKAAIINDDKNNSNTVLQIRRGNRDNLGDILQYFSTKNVMTHLRAIWLRQF